MYKLLKLKYLFIIITVFFGGIASVFANGSIKQDSALISISKSDSSVVVGKFEEKEFYPSDQSLTVNIPSIYSGGTIPLGNTFTVQGYTPPTLNGQPHQGVRFRIMYNELLFPLAREVIYTPLSQNSGDVSTDIQLSISGVAFVYIDANYGGLWVTCATPFEFAGGDIIISNPVDNISGKFCTTPGSDIIFSAKIYFPIIPNSVKVYISYMAGSSCGSSTSVNLIAVPSENGSDEKGNYLMYSKRIPYSTYFGDPTVPGCSDLMFSIEAQGNMAGEDFRLSPSIVKLIRFDSSCSPTITSPELAFNSPKNFIPEGETVEEIPKYLSTLPIPVNMQVTDPYYASWGLSVGEIGGDGWCAVQGATTCDFASTIDQGTREYVYQLDPPTSGGHTPGEHELVSLLQWYEDTNGNGVYGDAGDGDGIPVQATQRLMILSPEDIMIDVENNLTACAEIPIYGGLTQTIGLKKLSNTEAPIFRIYNDTGQEVQPQILEIIDGATDSDPATDAAYYFYKLYVWVSPDNNLNIGHHKLWFEVSYTIDGDKASFTIPLTVYETLPSLSVNSPTDNQIDKYPGEFTISVNAGAQNLPSTGHPDLSGCPDGSTPNHGVVLTEVEVEIKDQDEYVVYTGTMSSNGTGEYVFPEVSGLDIGIYNVKYTARTSVNGYSETCSTDGINQQPCDRELVITNTIEVKPYIDFTIEPDPGGTLKTFYAPASYKLKATVIGIIPEDVDKVEIFNGTTKIGDAINTGEDDLANRRSVYSLDLVDVPVGFYQYSATAHGYSRTLTTDTVLDVDVIKNVDGLRIIEPKTGDTKAENVAFDVQIVSSLTINQGTIKLYVDGIESGSIGPIDIIPNVDTPENPYIINCTGLTQGIHDLTVEAFDSSGNQVTGTDPSNVVSINVTLAPALEIVKILEPNTTTEKPQPVLENTPFDFHVDVNGWIPPNVQVEYITIESVEFPGTYYRVDNPVLDANGAVIIPGPSGLPEGQYNYTAEAFYANELVSSNVNFLVVVGPGITIGIDDDSSSSEVTGSFVVYTFGSDNLMNTQNPEEFIGGNKYEVVVKGSVMVSSDDTYTIDLQEGGSSIEVRTGNAPVGTTPILEVFEVIPPNLYGSYRYRAYLSLANQGTSKNSPFSVDVGQVYIKEDKNPDNWKITLGDDKIVEVYARGADIFMFPQDVKLYLDGEKIQILSTSADLLNFVFSFTDINVSPGKHILQAKGYLPTGAIFTSDPVEIEILAVPPVVTIVNPVNEEYIETLDFTSNVQVVTTANSSPLTEVKLELKDMSGTVINTYTETADFSDSNYAFDVTVPSVGDYQLLATAITTTGAATSSVTNIHVAELSITRPTEGQEFYKDQIVDAIARAVGTFPNGIAYQLNSDAALPMSAGSTSEEFIKDLGILPVGTHTIKALADINGDGSFEYESTIVNFIVKDENTPFLEVKIVTPVNEEYIETLEFVSTVEVTKSANSPALTEVKLELMDMSGTVVWSDVETTDLSSLTYSFDVVVPSVGDYKLLASLKAVAVADVITSSEVIIHVAELSITRPTEGQEFYKDQIVDAIARAVGTFPNGIAYQLNSDPASQMSSSSNTEEFIKELGVLPVGTHKIKALADIDGDGDFEYESAVVNFIVKDEEGPFIRIDITTPVNEEYIERLTFNSVVEVTRSVNAPPVQQIRLLLKDMSGTVLETYPEDTDLTRSQYTFSVTVPSVGDYQLVAELDAMAVVDVITSSIVNIHVAELAITKPTQNEEFYRDEVINSMAKAVGTFPNGIAYQLDSDAALPMESGSNSEEFIKELGVLAVGAHTIKALADIDGDGDFEYESAVINFIVIDQDTPPSYVKVIDPIDKTIYNTADTSIDNVNDLKVSVEHTPNITEVTVTLSGAMTDNANSVLDGTTSTSDFTFGALKNGDVIISTEGKALDENNQQIIVEGDADVTIHAAYLNIESPRLPENIQFLSTDIIDITVKLDGGDRVFNSIELLDGAGTILATTTEHTDAGEVFVDLQIQPGTLPIGIHQLHLVATSTDGVVFTSINIPADIEIIDNSKESDCSVIPEYKPYPMEYMVGDQVKEGELIYKCKIDYTIGLIPSENPDAWMPIGICAEGTNNPLPPDYSNNNNETKLIESLFPNPNIGKDLNVNLNVLIGEDYEVVLIDVKTTRRVFHAKGTTSMTGIESFSWDVSHVPPGQYMFVAKTDSKQETLYVTRK